MEKLIQKYQTEGPRYTSYPTVPYWDPSGHNDHSWKSNLEQAFWRGGKELSLYIHLPFCERLCTYCGCTTRITKNHGVEETYIDYLLKEWKLYLDTFPGIPLLKEIHLGGGTPTFFSPSNLSRLISGITKKVNLADHFEFGFEGHPGNTTEEHLRTLSSLGFTRISLGIQDFDEEVQKTINRKQPYSQVEQIVSLSGKYGFDSLNFDLIYGLPKQTTRSVKDTIEKTISLRPTRIAFYGYAHVPWVKKAQRSFEQFLPSPANRILMYSLGKELLGDQGYFDIGMDHFALETDSLFQAFQNGDLHRNFMGYTTQKSSLLIGLGMSSISDSWTAFSQNEKQLPLYYKKLDQGLFPIQRGHQLTHEDLIIRRHILNLMCHFQTSWDTAEFMELGLSYNFDLLENLADDHLIIWNEEGIIVNDTGKPFIRNICMALDARLWNSKKNHQFSKTI